MAAQLDATADGLGKYIIERTKDVWDTSGAPYMLSWISPELQTKGILYKTIIGPQTLKQFAALFENGVTPDNLSALIDSRLYELRKRQSPKRDSEYSTTYIVDDGGKYFEYGKERHSRLECSPPLHMPLCAVAGRYRFGRQLDADRHFNMSLANGLISGTLPDCHDAPNVRKPCSHINMFPNDFMP